MMPITYEETMTIKHFTLSTASLLTMLFFMAMWSNYALAANSTCKITLVKKNATAKTAFLGAARISSKLQTQIREHCEVSYRMMTTQELIALEKARFEKKIKKLQAQAGK